ncbi:MAG TPA: AraC family transcriptional regulator, partial [Chitinophagaceae bacterium]|nr:AraC family transcriptional regulator [Chitinophagaceae bacterium]
LPHTWFTGKGRMKCHAVVMQFHANFMQLLQEFPELVSIKKLLDKSSAGIHFTINAKSSLPALIKEIQQAKGAEALSKFILLLDKLSAEKMRVLASQPFRHTKRNANEKRINKIFQYVQQKYSIQISIAEAAAVVHLSVSAFCKFFKRAYGKTFSDYVNEIRIANACRLLIDTDKPVARVAFDSGFESLSYFNRVFLKKKKMRPNNFRKKMS